MSSLRALKYHFIAIGGTGMGALAGLLRASGHEVRGSDGPIYPPMSDQLAALGIVVFEGYARHNLDWQPDVVVVGNVCRKDHVEVQEATRRNLPLTSMPALLGEAIIADKRSLVVAGTHGKTTTTSLLGHLLVEGGRDPGLMVGGVPINLGRGWRLGDGPEFVVEGDEYDSAFFDKGSKFLHYRANIAILTSVEFDHADIFASMDEVRAAFARFVGGLPADGLLVVAANSAEARAIAEASASCPVQTYAVITGKANARPSSEDSWRNAADWVAGRLDYTKTGRCRFELYHQGLLYDSYETLLIGRHNISNAVAAIAVAHAVGVDARDIRRGLAIFAGVKRRQEVCGIAQGVYVLDDYGHHPTAIEETLRALRKRFTRRRLIAIFEPRSATSRRSTFQREFSAALAHADVAVVGRLYRPDGIPEEQRLDPARLALEVHNSGSMASYIPEVEGIVQHVRGLARPGDVIAVFSSGAFDGMHGKLLAALGDPIRPAKKSDMADVRALASKLGWDASGSDDGSVPGSYDDDYYGDFLVLHNENGFVGCVGLEVYGDAAILRSLAVEGDARGVGYGWLLADTAVQVARYRGVKRIYVTTADASDFFAAKLGFRIVDISTVSPSVASSASFRAQRDRGATAMRLDL